MPSRQDAIKSSVEASEMQKKLVTDIQGRLFPALSDVREIIAALKNNGIKIKVTKAWPLTCDITIKK